MKRTVKAPVAHLAEHRVRNSKDAVRLSAGAPVHPVFAQIAQCREDILSAFVAKYGITDPDEIEQVTLTDPANGNTSWFVRRRLPS